MEGIQHRKMKSQLMVKKLSVLYTMGRNWSNTAMALHHLDGVSIMAINEGTNVYDLKLSKELNPRELTDYL